MSIEIDIQSMKPFKDSTIAQVVSLRFYGKRETIIVNG